MKFPRTAREWFMVLAVVALSMAAIRSIERRVPAIGTLTQGV